MTTTTMVDVACRSNEMSMWAARRAENLTRKNVLPPDGLVCHVRWPTFPANLAAMPGYVEMNGVAIGADGYLDPHTQLFRSSFVGVETGPMISQVIGGQEHFFRLLLPPRRCHTISNDT